MKPVHLFKRIVMVALAVSCFLYRPTAFGLEVITVAGSTAGTNGFLIGIVNGITTNTRVHFEYGADLNYGNLTSPRYFNIPGSQIVDATVSGLPPGTYHYRILAVDINNTQIATGSNMSFTISGPSTTTLSPSLISANNVALNGFVNPNGVATTAYFQYGPTTNYGNTTMVTNVGAGMIPILVSNQLTGLTANRIYHFRVVASNSWGVSVGKNMVFTNQAPLLTAFHKALTWSMGITNTPVIQLAGTGASPLTYTIVKPPRFGWIVTTNVSDGGNFALGQCQYRPYEPVTFNGQDSFTYKVSNGTNISTEATISITVSPFNHAPHAQDQIVKVLKNSAYSGRLTGDDDADYLDPYTDQTRYRDPFVRGYHYSPAMPNLTYTILTYPTNGSLSTNFSNFTYTPNNNYVGKDGFTFRVNDGALNSANTGLVSIIVATNVGAIRPGFDKHSFGRSDDQGFAMSLTGTNSDWLGRDLLLQFSNNNFPSNYFTQFFANNNGNLTFNKTNPAYIGEAFPSSSSGPIIAPFWADVLTTDTRSGVMTFGMQYVDGRLAAGVTWTNVMTYGNTVNSNSFQVVLIDRSDVQVGNFDIEFNYDKIEWLYGSVSGGTYPSIGFDAGMEPYYNLPGARTPTLADTSTNGLIHNSNVIPPVPGRYVYRMYQPRAFSQSIVALRNITNTINLNPGTFLTQSAFATNYIIISGPTNGTLSGSGSTRGYKPNTNYAGPDAFTFTVSDGGRYATNTVNISVVPSLAIPGTNAALSALVLGTNSLIPAFNPSALTYTSILPKSVTNLDIVALCADTNATVQAQIDGVFKPAAWGRITNNVVLNSNLTVLNIKVTSADGTNTQTYTVLVRQLNTDNALAGLTLNPGSLTPAFSPTIQAYSSTVANSVGNTDVLVLSSDANATLQMQINGGAFSTPVSGVLSNRATLNFGSNVIKIKVTAEDGETSRTNTINVTRLLSTDATLSSVTAVGTVLTLNGGTYSGLFPFTASNTTLTATGNDPYATLKLDGNPMTSGVASESIPLPFGSSSHVINVTAQNGAFSMSYLVILNRQYNTNANLADLTCSDGLLNPLFSSNVTSYTLTVPNSVSSITVTPTSADSVYATIQVRLNGGSFIPVSSGASSGSLGLNIGTNIITILVNAHSGATKTYTLTVARPAGVSVAVTQPASMITTTGGLLNASVNPNGADTMVSFQYGSNTNYTGSTVATSIGSGTNSLSVSNLLSGLQPGTTNFFRVVASNSLGVAFGAEMSFMNLADVPTVTNVTAGNIAHSTVSLLGQVNPNGAVTVAYFQYGESTNYGGGTIVTNLGGGTTSLSLDLGVSDLLVGKTYHYQLVATNSAGVSRSADMTFTLFPLPEATGFNRQTDGSFQLRFSGGAGLSYTLQTSTDLMNWVNFTNLMAGTNGLFIFSDLTATNSAIRFYRLTQP